MLTAEEQVNENSNEIARMRQEDIIKRLKESKKLEMHYNQPSLGRWDIIITMHGKHI